MDQYKPGMNFETLLLDRRGWKLHGYLSFAHSVMVNLMLSDSWFWKKGSNFGLLALSSLHYYFRLDDTYVRLGV